MTGFCNGVSGTEDTSSESSPLSGSQVDPELEPPPDSSIEEHPSLLSSLAEEDFRWESAKDISRSLVLLRGRHVRSFQGERTYRAVLAKYVTSFTPVAQYHLSRKEDIPADNAMERNFPWQHRRIPPGEDSDMSLAIPNLSVKSVSAFKD